MKQARCEGFTLIEILISMTLMGLIATAIVSGFRLGIKAWTSGQEKTDQQRELQASFDLISRQVGSLLPYESTQRFEKTKADVLVFQAAPKGTRFVTAFSIRARSASGLRLVEYFEAADRKGSGKALVVQEWELPSDRVLGERLFSGLVKEERGEIVGSFFPFSVTKQAEYLIEDLESVDFGYLPQFPVRDGEPLVSPETQSKVKRRLPAGVQIRLTYSGPGNSPSKSFSVVVPIHVVA